MRAHQSSHRSRRRLVIGLALAPLAPAPAGPAAALQPGSRGQPASMADSMLAPIPPAAGPPPALGELQVDKIKVPPGLQGLGGGAEAGSTMRAPWTWGDKGHALREQPPSPATSTRSWTRAGPARGQGPSPRALNLPNGSRLQGTGRCMSPRIHRITKMPGIEGKLDNPPAMEVVYDILASRRAPRLEVSGLRGRTASSTSTSGAPLQHLHPPRQPTPISRRVQCGRHRLRVLRPRACANSVGFDWHPVTKELYFATHARDWLGEGRPRATASDTGSRRRACTSASPYCHQGDIPDPELGKGTLLQRVSRPRSSRRGPPRGRQTAWSSTTGSMFPRRVQEPRLPSPSAAPGTGHRKIGFPG